MKKGKIVLLVILFLLLALIVGLGIRLYPAWKSAEIMQEHLNLGQFTFEVEVELDKEELSANYKKIFQSMAQVAGVEEDALYDLTAKGTVWEDMIYVQIYYKDATEPLVEMYLSDELDVVNESRIYNAFRKNIIGRSELLSMLVPEGEDNVYMTLEQASHLFGLDLSAIASFSVPFTDMEFTTKEYFPVLAALKREKTATYDNFDLTMDRIWLSIEVPKDAEDDDVIAYLGVEEPAEALAEASELLGQLGIQVPTEEFVFIKDLDITAFFGSAAEPVMPTNFISQETINMLSEMVALAEQFAGK